jgi:hypothetical protein
MHQQQSPRPPQLYQMHQQQSPTTSSQRPVDSLQMKQPWTLGLKTSATSESHISFFA